MRNHRSTYALSVIALAFLGVLGFAGRADAWRPIMSATCDSVTLNNAEGETAHVNGDISTTIPPHGSITVPGPAQTHIVTSWYWENSAEPPIAGVVDRPGNCGSTTTVATTTPTTAPMTSTSAPCQEDEPCWDCATMGNRVCGTTTVATIVPDTTTVPDTTVPPSTSTSSAPSTSTTAAVVVPPSSPDTTTPRAAPHPTAETAAPVQQTASPAVVTTNGLPVTGAATDIMATAAVALILVGGVCLILATRRKAHHSG